MKHDIRIEPFKRSEYDRGSKKIIVDGEQWGFFVMRSRGGYAPAYHAHDNHDRLTVPRGEGWGKRKGEAIEHQYDLKGKRDARWNGAEIIPTEKQLHDEAARLIAEGHLRSPAVRAKEIEDEDTRLRLSIESTDRRAEQKLEERADAIIANGAKVGDFTIQIRIDALKAQIVAAMKWAQTQ